MNWYRTATALLLAVTLQPTAAGAQSWDDIVAVARGQTVYFNAWAGSEKPSQS